MVTRIKIVVSAPVCRQTSQQVWRARSSSQAELLHTMMLKALCAATVLKAAVAVPSTHIVAEGPGAAAAAAGLTLETYTNAAMSGSPLATTTVSSLDLSVPLSSTVGSAEVTGTLTYPATTNYAFECTFDPGQLAFVWVRDHLVCHTHPIPFGNTPSSTDGCPEYPLPGTAGQVMPVVVHIYNVNASAPTKISVRWAQIAHPMAKGSAPPTSPIGGAVLAPKLPAAEVQRRSLQDGLKRGWSTWAYNMLGVVRLPESSTLTTALCQVSSQKCLVQTHIEDSHAQIRVGVFATDASYWQFYLGYEGINVSMSYSGGTKPLNFVAEPVNCASANCSDFALLLLPRFAWFRRGDVTVDTQSGSISFAPMGLPVRHVQMTVAGQALDLPTSATGEAGHFLAATFDKGALGVQESAASDSPPDAHGMPSLASIQKVIQAARSKEYASYSKFGALADVKEAVQAATMYDEAIHTHTPHCARMQKCITIQTTQTDDTSFNILQVELHLHPCRVWTVPPGLASVGLRQVPRELGLGIRDLRLYDEAIHAHTPHSARIPKCNTIQTTQTDDTSFNVEFAGDNIFATYMTSLDCKDIAYSNFIQVIRSKTAKGCKCAAPLAMSLTGRADPASLAPPRLAAALSHRMLSLSRCLDLAVLLLLLLPPY
jgi:hypothetical protein